MADQPVETPAPAPEKMDVAQLKTMLNLPATASDIELITSLVQLVAGLQQKYDALLSDAVQLEDKVANRDLEDFADLVTPESRDFWKEQLLVNRDQSLAILKGLRKPEPPPTAPPAEAPKPLFRNRLINPVRTIADLAEDAPMVDASRAVKIRNRAHEISASEKIPYIIAFARAEKEIS
jgi:hypothetical protein